MGVSYATSAVGTARVGWNLSHGQIALLAGVAQGGVALPRASDFILRMDRKLMRTFIYKRTHRGDPNSETGMFGGRDCMGAIRDRPFGAIIGVGGIYPWPSDEGIACKLSWIGIYPHRFASRVQMGLRGPFMAFERFKDFGVDGPLLKDRWPNFAEHMYAQGARHIMNFSPVEEREIEDILKLARNALPSKHLKKWSQLDAQIPRRINDVSRRLKNLIDLQQQRAKLACPPCAISSRSIGGLTPSHQGPSGIEP